MDQDPIAPAEGDPNAYFSNVRQGHVFAYKADPEGWASAFPDNTEAVVVVSQTCDVVLAKRETVILGRVTTLAGDEARIARRRDNPRYVPIPLAGNDCYVDLAYLHTFDKAALCGLACTPGVSPTNDSEVRAFALAVGRWFSRFAFPDEVTPWLRPLYDVVRQKYDKPASALGMILHDVVELRLEAEDWGARPLRLTLHVIVRAGAMPTLEDQDMEHRHRPPTALRPDGSLKTPADLAPLLVAAGHSAEAGLLWGALAEALAALCAPRGRDADDPAIMDAVTKVDALLWADDEFPLSRVRKSEILDLDYLSPGFPT